MGKCRGYEDDVMDEEKTIWQGSPSQILNLHVFLLCGLAAAALLAAAVLMRERLGSPQTYVAAGAAVIPLLIAFVKYLQIKFQRYELTTERLRIRTGILSRQTDEIELYRVKDYILREPFSIRIFGLGDIAITTTDDANPNVLLRAVHHPNTLRDEIRKHVEQRREAKRVRIAELE
jgi:uncharacterized membrane protein YdbT with pleckstrin-like domain